MPFLDNDLVDFAQRVPVRFKMNKLEEALRIDENSVGGKTNSYYHKTNDGKLILRQALSQFMPTEYTNAVKQGFSAPDNTWFKQDSSELLARVLGGREAKLYDFFDYEFVSSKIKQHTQCERNNRLFIWSLMNMEFFLQQYNIRTY